MLAIAKKYNTDEFEFSQAYPFFWDHLEKSNFFLENIIDLAEEKMDSRMMEHFMGDPVSGALCLFPSATIC
jgi:bleomycin hydrolase